MNTHHSIVVSMIATLTLSACSIQPPPPIETSRVDSGSLYFFNDPINDGPVVDQVAALQEASDNLVRNSTVTGALTGAAVGCGLVLVSAANARNCLAGAAVGGAGGAVIGNRVGKADVSRRIELVEPNSVFRSLEFANSQFDNIQSTLPHFIAQQEADLNALTVRWVNGEIDQGEYDRQVQQIDLVRADLAQALDLTARDARRAARNLEHAASRGQTGLDWHISQATQLADDVESTRSSFSIL